MIGILNYGVGNLGSVYNAFDALGHEVEIFDDQNLINKYSHLILPGVGSFAAGMNLLSSRQFTQEIKSFAESGRPVLGICLGMQLLLDSSNEHGFTSGIGLIGGRVVRFSKYNGLKVPHVGWNSLCNITKHPVLHSIKPSVDMYFVHSYYCLPDEKNSVIAYCDYGVEFAAVIAKDNIVGVQFHPEKSQPAGLKLLNNFAAWDGQC